MIEFSLSHTHNMQMSQKSERTALLRTFATEIKYYTIKDIRSFPVNA